MKSILKNNDQIQSLGFNQNTMNMGMLSKRWVYYLVVDFYNCELFYSLNNASTFVTQVREDKF